MPLKRKILFLSACPIGQAQLRTSGDYKAIKKHLDQTRFELLLPELEVTIDDLIDAMSQQPEIVHFAGHGEAEGINIVDKNNITKLLSEEALKSLFEPHKETIQLVVLNSCYSAEQAKIISDFGFYVIGMNSQFGDKAARSFASGFYNRFFKDIKNKNPVKYAFKCGMTKLTTEFPDEVNIPEIWEDGKKLEL